MTTLKKLLRRYDVSWNEVGDGRLSVVPVDIAKGLEFEAVVAVTDGMSSNQAYVSYTRALERLVIVNSPGATPGCKP